jgi:hypothetical protein
LMFLLSIPRSIATPLLLQPSTKEAKVHKIFFAIVTFDYFKPTR